MNWKNYFAHGAIAIILFCPNEGYAAEKFNEIFKSESLQADPQDPYQYRPTKLCSQVLEKLPLSRRGFYEDPNSLRNDPSLISIGDFVYDKKACLGNGCEGAVYLAQHLPTCTFVAMKHSCPTKFYTDVGFLALQRLNRVFAYYSQEEYINKNKITYAYLFMPLVEGETLRHISQSQLLDEVAPISIKEGKLVLENFDIRLGLIKSLISQLTYLAKKGVYQREYNPGNILITHSLNEVVLVDFGVNGGQAHPITDSPIDPTVYEATGYVSFLTKDLLGIGSGRKVSCREFVKANPPQCLLTFRQSLDKYMLANDDMSGEEFLKLSKTRFTLADLIKVTNDLDQGWEMLKESKALENS